MTFKEELINLKKELQQNPNYQTRYVSEQFRDYRELQYELDKRNWYEQQAWSLYNTRGAIDEQKSESLQHAFKEFKKGIKSYISFLLERGVDFDSIDLVLDVGLLIEEELFKNPMQTSEPTSDNFLADTVHIGQIMFESEEGQTLITRGKNFSGDTTVSYSQLLKMLNGLGFTTEEKSFEELVENRKNGKIQELRFSIPLTYENENDNGDEPKGPSLK